MRLLDLFCCQGGASAGYAAAGFDVTGVDLHPQPRYPYRLIQDDAIDYAKRHGHTYDVIHASPPCQAYSNAQRIRDRVHPDLIGPTRDVLEMLGVPYIIENVPGAPLKNPVELCGAMFGLRTYRHRIFESTIDITPPPHPEHQTRQIKMGRALQDGDWYQAIGNFSGVAYVRRDLGVPWMNRDGIRESIPPAYTEHIGRAFLQQRKGAPTWPSSTRDQ